MLDSPEQAAWGNVKQSGFLTYFGCQRCFIPREELGNPDYDFRANERTAEGVDASIDYASRGETAAERARRETQRGVVIPEEANPLNTLTFNRLLQSPFEILHQDSLASNSRNFPARPVRCSSVTVLVFYGTKLHNGSPRLSVKGSCHDRFFSLASSRPASSTEQEQAPNAILAGRFRTRRT